MSKKHWSNNGLVEDSDATIAEENPSKESKPMSVKAQINAKKRTVTLLRRRLSKLQADRRQLARLNAKIDSLSDKVWNLTQSTTY
jgi:hypothetical protein